MSQPLYHNPSTDRYIWPKVGSWYFGDIICSTQVYMYYKDDQNDGKNNFWEVIDGTYLYPSDGEWETTTSIQYNVLPNGNNTTQPCSP